MVLSERQITSLPAEVLEVAGKQPNTTLIQGETLTFQINLTKLFGTEIDFTQFEIVGLELIETTITEINQLASIDVDIFRKNELEGE